jgi:hypothetical protein
MGFIYPRILFLRLPILKSFTGCYSQNLKPLKMGSHMFQINRVIIITSSGVTEDMLIQRVRDREWV